MIGEIQKLNTVELIIPRADCLFVQIEPREILRGSGIVKVGMSLSCFNAEVRELTFLHSIRWRVFVGLPPLVAAGNRPENVETVGDLEEADRYRLTVQPFVGTLDRGTRHVSGFFLNRWEALP